jgi:hypothetical protein
MDIGQHSCGIFSCAERGEKRREVMFSGGGGVINCEESVLLEVGIIYAGKASHGEVSPYRLCYRNYSTSSARP